MIITMAPICLHPPERLTSDEGHYATVHKVEKGRFEGKWQLRIERPGQKPKIYHTTPSYGAVRTKMAKFLELPLSSITVHIGDPHHPQQQETPSTPTHSNKTTPFKIPTTLTTEYGHHGTITPTGRYWDLDIKGPMAPFGETASAMTTSVSSHPSEQSAKELAAMVLAIPETSIQFHYDSKQPKRTPLTPTPTNKPLDKFELSPNARATCHKCHERITKHSERVGIQEWNDRYKHWQPVYYHKDCCTEEMLQSLKLGGDKRKWQGDSTTTSGSVEKKLKTELQRQDERETFKRRLVYGNRLRLREDLRRLRMEFATQLEMEPYKVFDDATLDDVVAKLPSTEKELLKCHGIAQKRCDCYGGAILQLISQYQQEIRDDDVLSDGDSTSSHDDDL